MGTSEQRRAELGTFLRARRSQLDRAAVGLPQAGRRRITGLRREEVATLSAVSVTWYTWLEQGRDVNPSGRSSTRLPPPCDCPTPNTVTCSRSPATPPPPRRRGPHRRLPRTSSG